MASIMDFFRSSPPAVQQQPNTTPNDPSKQNPSVPGDGTQKSDGNPAAIPAAAEGDKSPLAEYAKLWQKDPNDPKRPSLVPNMKVDPAKLMEAAKGIDFTKALNPEAISKAAKGDEAALMQVINEAAQAGFAQATGTTATIVTEALQRQAETFKNEVMPDILRRHEIKTSVAAENPIFENPAVAPMLSMVESQLASKYPQETPAQITTRAKSYLEGMATSIVETSGRKITDLEPAPGTKGSKAAKETDWSKFFDAE